MCSSQTIITTGSQSLWITKMIPDSHARINSLIRIREVNSHYLLTKVTAHIVLSKSCNDNQIPFLTKLEGGTATQIRCSKIVLIYLPDSGQRIYEERRKNYGWKFNLLKYEKFIHVGKINFLTKRSLWILFAGGQVKKYFFLLSGLIRRYLPKGKSLAEYSESAIMLIQELWNELPRKILGYLTHQEMFDKELENI